MPHHRAGHTILSARVPIVTGMVSLSPSRIADFKTCPLLYRFRAIDRLPEPPSADAVRGTLVHAVLERIFDSAPAERTPQHAHSLAEAEWERMLAHDDGLAVLIGEDPADEEQWLQGARRLLDAYFTLENPAQLEPAERELLVQTALSDDVSVKGVIDRVDVAPTGEVRIVDYKSGRAPSPLFEQRALFQLRVYALLLWRVQGRLPAMLQLIYLADAQIVRLTPDERDLVALERTLQALATAIGRAQSSGDFRPRPSRLCDWCSHQALCPAWGGTPPAYPGAPETPPQRSGEVPTPDTILRGDGLVTQGRVEQSRGESGQRSSEPG
jgi:putative RecB family exonuclease